MKQCNHCRRENRDQAQFCGHCGQPLTTDTLRQKKPLENRGRKQFVGQGANSRVAILLSFLWPGLGQLYNGRIFKGAAFAIAQIVFCISSYLALVVLGLVVMWAGLSGKEPTPQDEGFIGGAFIRLCLHTAFWVYAMIDAKREAEDPTRRVFAPMGKVLPSFASGLVVGILLTASFLAQELAEVKAPTATHPTAARVEPKDIASTRATSVVEREPTKAEPKTTEPPHETSASLSPAGGEANPGGSSEPLQALEYMGVPYTESAFYSAAEKGKTDAVRLFLAAGMKADVRSYSSGPTGLISAAENGHGATVYILINNGADVNAKTGYGQTALMMAAEHGHAGIVQMLLDKGADVNVKNLSGYTALALAAKNSHTNIVRLLGEAKTKEK